MKQKIENKCKYPFVSTISRNKQYFGIPIFFFRLNFTCAVRNIPVAFVRWIQFEIDEFSNNRNCCVGRIPMAQWLDSDLVPPTEHENVLPPFISFNDLLPSRFALSYIEPTNLRAFDVQCALLGLDSHKLGKDVDDNFHH